MMMKKNLTKILSTFTKAQKDLEVFIDNERKVQDDIEKERIYLEDRKVESTRVKNKAEKVLGKINEILGD